MDAERTAEVMAEALRAGVTATGTSRAPKFGEWMRGIWASERNPQRDGMFVRTVRRTGRMNPGTFYELTDGKGEFWQYPAGSTVFIEAHNCQGEEGIKPYKCRLCGKSISELRGAYLTRVNEKGVPGIWECRPACESDLPQETLLMMAIESDDKEAPNCEVSGLSAAGREGRARPCSSAAQEEA